MSLSVGILTGSTSRLAGGLFNSVRRSALELANRGCAVTVYGLSDEYAQLDLRSWYPIVPKAFTVRGPRSFGYAPGLAEAVLGGKHDLLHQHGIWQYSSLVSTQWGNETGGPVIISPRGMLDAWALQNARWKKTMVTALFERSNLRQARCLHALNQAEAAAFREFKLDNPIAVVPNGADLPSAASQNRSRPAFLGDDRRKVLLFLGRLHPKKGLTELIAAWKLVAALAPTLAASWVLVIAGWQDDASTNFSGQLQQVKYPGRDILIVGPSFGKEKEELLNHASAFILPSYSEGLPVAVLEAWAYGLPVFMTAACNLPEAAKAGAAIQISTDPQDIAEKLITNLASDSLCEVGARGRALVSARYTWDQIGRDFLSLYSWLLETAPAPNFVEMS